MAHFVIQQHWFGTTQKESRRVASNAPVLVSCGPFVKHYAPEATNLNMIYTDDDYAKMCQRQQQHPVIPHDKFLQEEQRSNVRHEENQPRNNQYQDENYLRYHSQWKDHHLTESYSTDVQFINSSGKLISYRVIRPKVTGAPVSVMVE